MIDTLLLSLVGLSLLLGQLGRISLGNGIQFYALELLVLLHTVVILLRNGKWSLRGIRRVGGQRDSTINAGDDTVIARSPTFAGTTRQSHVNVGLLRHALRSFPRLPRLCESIAGMVAMTTIRKTASLWLLYVVTLFYFTALGKSPSDNIKAGMYIARIGLFATYFGLLIRAQAQNTAYVRILRIISIVTPIVCLTQYFLLPDLRFLTQFGWDPHMYRAVGLMFDPPIVGTVLGVLLFVTLRQALLDKTTYFKIPFQDYVPVLLNFIAIIFLFSRSTYVAIAAVIFLYFVSQRKYTGAFLWIIVLSVSIYLAPKTIPAYFNLESAKIERVSTVLSRKVELENGLRAWIAHPIFGIGYNRVAEYKQSLPRVYGKDVSSNHSTSAFHSFWLTQLATTGIIGFALLAGVYILAMKRSLYWALALSIPAIIGILDNVVFHPFVLTVFILVYFSRALDTHTLHINT